MSQPNVTSPLAPSLLLKSLHAKRNPCKDTHPSFADQTILITGANTGVGYAAALKFLQNNVTRLIIAVRSLSKGEDAKHRLEAATGRKNVVEVWHLDMLDYTSIVALAQRATKEIPRLDVAVLNAGIYKARFERSSYGWEQTLQVNVLSTTLLALLLLPKLAASKSSSAGSSSIATPVLEIVGSGAQHTTLALGSLPKTDSTEDALTIANDERTFGMGQYGVSKLLLQCCVDGLTNLVNKSYSSTEGTPDVHVITVCPAATRSNLARENTNPIVRMVIALFAMLSKTEEEGARTYVSGVALGEKGHGAGLWQNDEIQGTAPLLQGKEGETLQRDVWRGVLESLKKDVPEVGGVAGV